MLISLTYKLPPLINSVRIDTQPSGVFQNVPYNLVCNPVSWSLLYRKTAQSRRLCLTSFVETGSSLTAYNFNVGACNIFLTAPESNNILSRSEREI